MGVQAGEDLRVGDAVYIGEDGLVYRRKERRPKMSSLTETIKYEWEHYRAQTIGIFLLVAAFVTALMGATIAAWVILGVIGIFDLCLIYVKRSPTITKRARQWTGHRADNVIMLSLIGISWWLMGETVALWFTLGLLNNHLFERND